MTTNIKSMSEQLFELLVKDYPIGIRLTSGDLMTTANIHGIKCSMGAVAGFMNRAVEKGVVELIGAVIIDLKKNKKTFVYQVLHHRPWDFKAPGKGSPLGRKLKSYNLPNVELIEHNGTHNGEPIKVVESKPEPKDEAQVHFGADKAVQDWAEKSVKDGTAVEDIMIRLAEVMTLINAMPTKKSMAEATDDELIAEVKRRFHQ